MRIGAFTARIAVLLTVIVLASSAMTGLLLVSEEEFHAEVMDDKWVFVNYDSRGIEMEFGLGALVDSRGTLICDDGYWSSEGGFCAIDPNGTLLWRARTNANPLITEGPNGWFYYIDWDTAVATQASWSNLTALDSGGAFKWDYVVPVGDLSLSAVYPDGQVIVHNYDWTAHLVDRFIAVSSSGSELWSVDTPENTSLRYPRISENGTFEVTVQEGLETYMLGISKDGTEVFTEEGEYLSVFTTPSDGRNETVVYQVRKEFIDHETSVTSVYAYDLRDGSVVWRTILHYSDNPDNTPAGAALLGGTRVDSEGRIFCGDVDGEFSYCLSPAGEIMWEKPDLGLMVDVFPSGGLLVRDDSSIKRLDVNGSLVSRHKVNLDGYSFVVLGNDETVYYSIGAEVHAIVPSSKLSEGKVTLLVFLVADVVAVSVCVLILVLRSRQSDEK